MCNKIAKYASELVSNLGYKDKGTAKALIGNLANFKCKEGIYNIEYNEEFYSPQTWWKFIDNTNNNILQRLALKIFSIVPHSASCERVFSGLGWFYANHRQNLSVTTIESMSKIRHFCFKHVHGELQYNDKNYTEQELIKMLEESNLFDEEDELDLVLEEDINLSEIVDEKDIPQDQVYVLIMANDIDLTNSVFNVNNDDEDDEIDNSSDSKSENNEADDNNVEDFDIDEILNNVSFNK
jgi:hypothetical protein